jgi:hypothetical protein
MTSKRPPLPYYDEPPTKMEVLVEQVRKTATTEAIGSVHPISVRIPTIAYTTLQAVSNHSGMSMNKLIVSLLDVALDEMWHQLSEEDQSRISELRSGYLGLVMDEMKSKGSPAQAEKGEI